MSEQPAIKKAPARVKVKLKKRHTHAGIEYDEAAIAGGVEIDVTERQASALKEQGVI
jgi:hypothetical protein